MSYRNRPLGALVSPHDRRDYTLAKVGQPILASLPDEFPGGSTPEEWSKHVPPNAPYDQDIYGMCVAFGLSLIKSMQEHKERSAWEDYSPGFIYGWRDLGDYKGEGMYPREALSCLAKRGVCPKKDFPMLGYYGKLDLLIQPQRDHLLRTALPQKVKTYVSLQSVNEIKTALMTMGVVGMSIPVYESFYEGGHLNLPDKLKEEFSGNHFIAVIGWTRDNRWVIANSWGKNWGSLRGFCTIPFDYPKNEAWSITDLSPVEPVVKMSIGNTIAYVGDKTIEMRVAPVMLPDPNDPRYGVTMIPLREAAQLLGIAVDWIETGVGKGDIILTPKP